MRELKFAVFGTGFWARFQLAAWSEIEGARCVALYNRTLSKAEALAREFNIPKVFDDAEELLQNEQLDFIDIITDVETHQRFVELAARYQVPVICQKPMASSFEAARAMVEHCDLAKVPFFIHENWRWQKPIRELKKALESGAIGTPFRARIDFVCSFPVFDNQPFLKELEQFILTDIGSHILDTARFFFGDASQLYCQTKCVHPDIKGEDVATVMMEMNGVTVTCNMSYASRTEAERFPQTFAFVEGSKGSLELATDYWLRLTDKNGTTARRVPPPRYSWADPAYDVVHASIVECNRNLLDALYSGTLPETNANDNLKTVELVFAAYESAAHRKVVTLVPSVK
jgi:predicted dehydrogenase